MTDNGTCFTSSEFESFLTDNGIHHLINHSPISSCVKRSGRTGRTDRQERIEKEQKWNFSYSVITYIVRLSTHPPPPKVLLSPAELLLKRQPRSKLDLLRPSLADRVEKKQQIQKDQHDLHSRESELAIGTKVWVHNKQKCDKWLNDQWKSAKMSYGSVESSYSAS